MWTLRRASIHLKNRGICSGTAKIYSRKSDIERCYWENYNAGYVELEEKLSDVLQSSKFYHKFLSFSKSCCEVRSFSSHPDARSSGKEDDELEDGFSELETTHEAHKAADFGDGGLISESELSEQEEDVVEAVLEGKTLLKNRDINAMTKAILAAATMSVGKALDKLVEEGNEVTEAEVISTMLYLRKRKMYLKALLLSEWLDSTKHLELSENHYAARVDLIAKVRGIAKAEAYIQQIPESFRGEFAYRTLLANCSSVSNLRKTEEVFNKMKNLGFAISPFSCNQLLLVYRRTDKKKIADVLLLMEKENIKPTLFTYRILIDVKGLSNDISGMEQIVETMKSEGVEPNIRIQASLARHYANAGLKDKAESVLKEIEGDDITKKSYFSDLLLPLYATLGREDEVERLWKACEPNPRLKDCLAGIEAWGRLKKIEKAEAAFDKVIKKSNHPSSKHFTALLKVYTDHKMLAKGKDLVKRMGESGCRVGPLTWDALVKLYVGAGEVEKADSILDKAVKQKIGRPLFSTYLAILEQYSKRGDIHNAEKMFLKMKQNGYVSRIKQYQFLIQAYLNAKAPAYGFSDRMKADNMYPNKELAYMLARADAFKKTPVSELLD